MSNLSLEEFLLEGVKINQELEREKPATQREVIKTVVLGGEHAYTKVKELENL